MRLMRFAAAITLLLLAAAGCGGSSAPGATAELVKETVGSLDPEVRESSGLAIVEGRLYTHNDSGGAPLLYEINASSGETLRTITVNNATNVDWEDLATDGTYLYIADTGNNAGSRTEFSVYRLPLETLGQQDAVDAEQIRFAYPGSEPLDAEALIAVGGQLYLFTKGWDDYVCRLYRLPALPGVHDALLLGEQTLRMLVAGAAPDATGERVALVGYTDPYNEVLPFKSMLVTLDGFGGDAFFSGTVATYEIGDTPIGGQYEAAAFNSDTELYLTAEGIDTATFTLPAKLYRVQLPE